MTKKEIEKIKKEIKKQVMEYHSDFLASLALAFFLLDIPPELSKWLGKGLMLHLEGILKVIENYNKTKKNKKCRGD